MTREEAEECHENRLKVVTRYGLGEICTLCPKNSSVQYAEIALDDPKYRFNVNRFLYLSSISKYMPATKMGGDEVVVSEVF